MRAAPHISTAIPTLRVLTMRCTCCLYEQVRAADEARSLHSTARRDAYGRSRVRSSKNDRKSCFWSCMRMSMLRCSVTVVTAVTEKYF